MESWFTVEEIDRETFVISEYKHWEETHCYLLCGEKFSVLIDTGLGVSNIKQVVDRLTKLPIIVVTTHVHWDHIGGHRYFDNIAVLYCESIFTNMHRRYFVLWAFLEKALPQSYHISRQNCIVQPQR